MKFLIAIAFGVFVHVALGARPPRPRQINYSITVWVGAGSDSNENSDYSVKLRSPKNTTLYEAMNQAATKDPRFHFEATLHPIYGHFITKIGSNANDPAT